MNKVTEEQEARALYLAGLEVNGETNAEYSNEGGVRKKEMEDALTIDGYVARVIIWLGDYLKVTWFKNNKPFTTYKSKDNTVTPVNPLKFLGVMRSLYEPGFVPVTGVTMTPAQTVVSRDSGPFTVQYTAVVSPSNATNKDVTYRIEPALPGISIDSDGLLSTTENTVLGEYQVIVEATQAMYSMGCALTVEE